ncbi:MAG: FAD-dependent oxidoreductase [Desulfobacteraceae bacterium]|nr:MAG: FAD-dependent oxidoreductase [Desulfobacteraceae bacterium]
MTASKSVLIANSGLAGLQAALDLADSGLHVDLIESASFYPYDSASGLAPHLVNTLLLEAIKHPGIAFRSNTDLELLENKDGIIQAQLRQRPRYVDLSKCTACGDCISVCPVQVPQTDRKAIYLRKETQPGVAAIDKQGLAPCSNACPGGIPVQGYVALIGQGRFQEALDLIREHIPFPGICGRICTHPCEFKCRRLEIDAPVAIRLLKRFVTDWENKAGKEKKSKSRGKIPVLQGPPVAVVGSGPAGMAAADRLARLGYAVTVFEQLPVIGGMLSVGIPAYRLPREIISQEYDLILKTGVKLELNTPIGPQGKYTLDQLFAKGFKAVCLAVGAHQSQALQVPGEDCLGVVHGIDLLKTISLSQQTDDPQHAQTLKKILSRGAETRAVILGGGNTAMDVSRALKRLGLKEVRVLYRRTRQEMPAYAEEIEDALHEGVVMEFLTAPVRILGDSQKKAIGLECLRMQLSEPDASGRRKPVSVAGSAFKTEADLIVLAIGQALQPNFSGPQEGHAIQCDDRIRIDAHSFQTSRLGVFAVGDAVTRDKMSAIEAIAMGKKVVPLIDAFLKGQTEPVSSMQSNRPIANRSLTTAEQEFKPREISATAPLPERLTSFKEVELGYTEQQAITEARRCLICGPCSECLACEKVCKPGAINHKQTETEVKLEIGAVILPQAESAHCNLTRGLYRVDPRNILSGSAAAGRIMAALTPRPALVSIGPQIVSSCQAPRIGVFLCECEGQIAARVDLEKVGNTIKKNTGVMVVHTLGSSCTAEGIQALYEIAGREQLNRIVLAACSCCSADQVCYSCSFQRVRCRSALGLLGSQRVNPAQSDLTPLEFELVNIREQCALVHDGQAEAATRKTIALVQAALAKLSKRQEQSVEFKKPERTVLIMGQGGAADVCRELLATQDIGVGYLRSLPERIERVAGFFQVFVQGQSRQVGALVLAPQNHHEINELQRFFKEHFHDSASGARVRKNNPGVVFCDPNANKEISGASAAAQVQVWLNRARVSSQVMKPSVDPTRCRACGTCREICHCNAPQWIPQGSRISAWIDPLVCQGCGACEAWCPSGAIHSGDLNDIQLEAVLEALLR